MSMRRVSSRMGCEGWGCYVFWTRCSRGLGEKGCFVGHDADTTCKTWQRSLETRICTCRIASSSICFSKPSSLTRSRHPTTPVIPLFPDQLLINGASFSSHLHISTSKDAQLHPLALFPTYPNHHSTLPRSQSHNLNSPSPGPACMKFARIAVILVSPSFTAQPSVPGPALCTLSYTSVNRGAHLKCLAFHRCCC